MWLLLSLSFLSWRLNFYPSAQFYIPRRIPCRWQLLFPTPLVAYRVMCVSFLINFCFSGLSCCLFSFQRPVSECIIVAMSKVGATRKWEKCCRRPMPFWCKTLGSRLTYIHCACSDGHCRSFYHCTILCQFLFGKNCPDSEEKLCCPVNPTAIFISALLLYSAFGQIRN